MNIKKLKKFLIFANCTYYLVFIYIFYLFIVTLYLPMFTGSIWLCKVGGVWCGQDMHIFGVKFILLSILIRLG